jgi:hypothetical protein
MQYVNFDGVALEFEGARDVRITDAEFSERTPAIRNTDSEIEIERAKFAKSEDQDQTPQSP